MAEVVIASDIYGTLLSLETATQELEQHFRGDAQRARAPTLSPLRALDGVLAAYNRLQAFPDVEEALRKITAIARIKPVVFSHGTVDMVRACLSHAPPQLQHLQLQQYKPAPAAYSHLREQVASKGGGSSSSTAMIWLISANPFDIAGAKSAGLSTNWVDRDQNQAGWSDQALPEVKPTATIRRLAEQTDNPINP
ncbi:hypothetical protein ASPACDRAFT_1853476 [Aspergillus aculeatus ATCC 16872]|uniref:Haloacid dehalogenase n=1 Tax=Aspergillus aculeatus (strain ATCC 16872 / CBS 172.66 / WB 5094) TaxID=690307 RepID=A0A1L9X347_ASPA1|nr:uncharacterized protein ASPACDRAFT_1853476 [Aspergillus aculeatus ATCC 16872]OJK02907.1 hypothetical protein ASPACDRAFT_1853476 [Aspergillus aculeatus ATCC 16872]